MKIAGLSPAHLTAKLRLAGHVVSLPSVYRWRSKDRVPRPMLDAVKDALLVGSEEKAMPEGGYWRWKTFDLFAARRLGARMSRKELAKRLGLNAATIGQWEIRGQVRTDYWVPLCRALGATNIAKGLTKE